MTQAVKLAAQLCTHMGPGWLAYRAIYAAGLRAGWLRHELPRRDWDAVPLERFLQDPACGRAEVYLEHRRTRAPRFFFQFSEQPAYKDCWSDWDQDAKNPVMTSERLAEGNLVYFGQEFAHTGFPPEWHRNPFTGLTAPTDRHWSEISDFRHGDIKVLWEPSRFSFAYDLVRAYWRTNNEKYAELFWQLVSDWYIHNPPQTGVNWKCGQEISLRLMAWIFGLYGFIGARATTPDRVRQLAQMIAVSVHRIAANIGYALSQKNNHGITESVGLFTVGTLFPELASAQQWERLGRHHLEAQVRELFYEDGSFAQHSLNYQRLALHDCLWAARLAELAGRPFSADLYHRLGQASMLLYQLQDDSSGQAPCYGHNDGALVLPLNNCDYTDFRPVTQALNYLCSHTLVHGAGPWNEDLLWLFGLPALDAPIVSVKRINLRAEQGGYYTLRSREGFAFVRCPTYRHRPGQADLLHVDLWWRGLNIAVDPGSYSYNAPAPWDNTLSHTTHHNTVTVDGLNQMGLFSRFLWLPWAKGRVLCNIEDFRMSCAYWEGEHDGYARLQSPVTHRRGIVQLDDECWLVADLVHSERPHTYRLHWLFCDSEFYWNAGSGYLKLHTLAGEYSACIGALPGAVKRSLVRADPDGTRGWVSRYYYHREPALSIEQMAMGSSVSFWTVLSPGDFSAVAAGSDGVEITTSRWQRTVRFANHPESQEALVNSISASTKTAPSERLPLNENHPDTPGVRVSRSARRNPAL
jgi:asparagine synthase (glutamine-hydrolysing)